MDLTILEIHIDDTSFSADRPFSNLVGDDNDEDTGAVVDDLADNDPTAVDDDGEPTDEPEATGPEMPTTALAAVGVLTAVVGVALALRRFVGGEDPDVDIETPEDDETRPVGVTVDE
jgi:hypothetical protein